MKSLLLKSGARLIAQMVAGEAKKINGMYIEYADATPSSVWNKDANYFESLLKSSSSGYARVPIQHSFADDNNVATFSSMVTSQEFKGGAIHDTSLIVGATLIYMINDNTVDDVLVFTTLFDKPVRVAKDAYSTVHVGLTLGT